MAHSEHILLAATISPNPKARATTPRYPATPLMVQPALKVVAKPKLQLDSKLSVVGVCHRPRVTDRLGKQPQLYVRMPKFIQALKKEYKPC